MVESSSHWSFLCDCLYHCSTRSSILSFICTLNTIALISTLMLFTQEDDPFLAVFFEDAYDSSDHENEVLIPAKIRAKHSKYTVFTLNYRENSVFWKKYILPAQHPSSGICNSFSLLGRRFHRRFLVLYDLFDKIISDIKVTCGLDDCKVDNSRRKGVDLRLLVL